MGMSTDAKSARFCRHPGKISFFTSGINKKRELLFSDHVEGRKKGVDCAFINVTLKNAWAPLRYGTKFNYMSADFSAHTVSRMAAYRDDSLWQIKWQ